MNDTPDRALLLVGLALTDGHECAELLGDSAVHLDVAQVQGAGRSLSTALDDLWHDGHRAIDLVAMTATTGPVAVSWVRRVAGAWLRDPVRHRDPPAVRVCQHVLRLGCAGGRREDLEWCHGGLPDAVLDAWGWRQVTGAEAGLSNPAWQDLPSARYHVLVCRGPRCNAQGGQATAESLLAELGRRGATDDDVLVTLTGCLYPCNHAPVVVVHPDCTWVRLPADAVPDFVDGLLGPWTTD